MNQSDIPFRMSPSGFKYLGINITRNLTSLFSANFSPLMSEIKTDLQRWRSLPLSLIGRINTVKMNILPKFLFLFQCLPLFLSKRFFKTIDQDISSFLWCGKTPRISKSMLQRCKLNAGLSLPNFQLYYWASHIHKILFWLRPVHSPWCTLEVHSCGSSSPMALLTSSTSTNFSGFTDNPVVRAAQKMWYQFRKNFKFVSASLLTPLLKNHSFQPASSDPTFAIWHDKGLTTFKDLYKDGAFRSFADLSSEFQLPPSHLFRYFQVRHCAKSLFPTFPSIPLIQLWDDFLLSDPLQKSRISGIYNKLLSYDSSPIIKIKVAWEGELGLTLHEDWWDGALSKIHKSTICARLSLIQFKVLHRIHFSKTRLSQIYPTVIDRCDKCHASPCNLTHMFYSCPLLFSFWQNYFDSISEILSITVKPSPHIAIFGYPEDYDRYNSTQLDLLAFTSLLARRRLLFHWKSTKPPSSTQWLRDVMSLLKLEKIRYSRGADSGKFHRKWQPFLTFFKSLPSLPSD